MNRTLSRLAPLALAFLASPCVHSADAPAAPLAVIVTARFKQLDKNNDGKLDAGELANYPWLKALDKSGKGFVTLEDALIAFAPGGQKGGTVPAQEESPREAPKRLKPSEYGISAMIPDFTAKDLDGKEIRLSTLQQKKPLIVAFVSTSCPVSKKTLPSIAALAQDPSASGVSLLLVDPTSTDSTQDLRTALAANHLTAPCVMDADGAIARTLGAMATTDTFLIDGARTLIYRGAIDDQYGLGYSLDAPRHRYLADALASLKAGKPAEPAATEAPGCALDLSKANPVAVGSPTYHNRISRLVQANCQECHRDSGIAPFPLETYEQVSAKAGMIRKMVSRDLMPPWFASAPAAGEHSPWINDRSLSARDKSDLLAWIEAGKPAGSPADAPVPRTWPVDWQIGSPDAILQIPQPIEVNATGTMPYQNVTVETGFTEDKWVRGFEIRPTAREVVHHVLVFVEEPGSFKRKRDGISGFFAAYVPGNNAVIYPDGFAKPVPAGARLLFQIHYTPNGTATHDQVRMGLLFAKEPPKHVVHVAGIANVFFKIPPGDGNFPVIGTIPVPRPVKVLGFMPHMHLRGKAFRYEALLPDGTTKTLLDVPRYDFNWQLAYRYADPISLPIGTTVRATGWFDNSADNPANPDPSKQVHWGPQTSDEMMLGYVEYYFTDEIPAQTRLSSAK